MKRKNFSYLFLIFVAIHIISLIQISCNKNPTSAPPFVDYAISFDGIDDCIIINAQYTELDNITTNITIESWIYIKSFPNRAPRIIDRSDNKYGDRFLLAVLEPNRSVHLNMNGVSVRSNPLPLNRWIHVAGTYNGEEMKIFVNGDSINSITYHDKIDVTLSDLYIGNDDSLTNRQFDGYLDEIRIWNVCRSKDEIRYDMHHSLIGNEEGLICYWDFNEGYGQVIFNKSSNHIHGHLGTSKNIDSSDPSWIMRYWPHK
jgi:hypothetical protein